MKVTITDKCDRCKREAPREVEHTEVDALVEAEKKSAQTATHIEEVLAGVQEEAGGAMPDLVVYLRGEVTITNRVCDAFCLKTVTNARDTMFKDISERKGRPKKANGAKDKAKKTKTTPSEVKDDKKTAASSPAK